MGRMPTDGIFDRNPSPLEWADGFSISRAARPSQIGFLYPWMPNKDNRLMDSFLTDLQAVAPTVRLHGDDR